MSYYHNLSTEQLLAAQAVHQQVLGFLDEVRNTTPTNPLIDDQFRVYRMFAMGVEVVLSQRVRDVSETAVIIPMEEILV